MADAAYTRPATWDDVKLVARLLDEAGVEYALIGGYALIAHGANRVSEDIDLLVNPRWENTEKWVSALSGLPDGAAAALRGDTSVFSRENRLYAIRINDEFTVDVLPQASGHTWDELSAYLTIMECDGVPVRTLTLEGLLLTKQGLRDKDKLDAALISQAINKIRGSRS